MDQEFVYFWFRRDLRTDDNHGLFRAVSTGKKVLPVFIFDTDILHKLASDIDSRVEFTYNEVKGLKLFFQENSGDFHIETGSPEECWKRIFQRYGAADIYTNSDYEPYAIDRDNRISQLCTGHLKQLYSFKDQVIFEKDEITKDDGKPYTVFTPYARKWRSNFNDQKLETFRSDRVKNQLLKIDNTILPALEKLGFRAGKISFPPQKINASLISNYENTRDFPAQNGTSHLSVHLRFGTVSARKAFKAGIELSEKWTNELIWREFYMQILWHFPFVVNRCFNSIYDHIDWVNNETEFRRWCEGDTGYPLVDAGMRELNATGYMHNRVRMVTASFLTKHLLIDWKWGEAYFAEKLLDFELSSNNGGWQWAAGCGVDAAPYFRIFNPTLQAQKFDPQNNYIRKWVPEFDTLSYPSPIIDHESARKRCLKVYGAVVKPQ